MQRLWPDPGPVDDVDALVAAEARPTPTGRPWVAVNMVASLDGASSIDGVSGALGGDADRAVFGALRAAADVVLAGAGTVRAERYGPARPTEARRAARRARGQTEAARIAVVTTSLDLDLAAPLFTEADEASRTLVVTCEAADRDRRAAVAERADVIVAGADRVDLAVALARLRELGAGFVLAEGGPRLNGDLLAADLVDEWCMTLAPTLVGGEADGVVVGAGLAHPRGLRLDRVLEGDGELLLRHVR